MISKAEIICRVSNYTRIGIVEEFEQDVDRLLKTGSLVPTELAHDVRGQSSPRGIGVGRELSSNLELQRRATVLENRDCLAS